MGNTQRIQSARDAKERKGVRQGREDDVDVTGK